MANAYGSVVMRSVLDVDGRSFDVVLSDTALSWGHVGIEEHGLGEKSCSNVLIAKARTEKRISYYEPKALQNCNLGYTAVARFSFFNINFSRCAKKVTRFRRHWC